MPTLYSLTCINNSQLIGSFAVFQKPPPTVDPAKIFSLAWLVRAVHPGTQVTFQWSMQYCFVWSETGSLRPGTTFSASQSVPADPIGQNFTQLTEDGFGATYFTPTSTAGAVGSLTIQQLSNVVPNRTSCGIGMSGSATFVMQVMPDMTSVFTPQPSYWVVFGSYMPGQVMDTENITGEIKVSYPGALTSHTVTLDRRDILTVT